MSPEVYYYVGLALIVLPAIPFSRSARIVAAAWIPGQIFWLLGASPMATDMAIDILAVGAAFALFETCADAMVAALFVPMAALNMAWAVDAIEPFYAWWLLWGMAMAQLSVLPFTVDWQQVKNTFNVRHVWSHRP